MKKISIFLLSLILVIGTSSAQTKKATTKPTTKPAAKTTTKAPVHTVVKQPKKEKEQRVEITTEFGTMIVKLYNETPKHRDNFIKLVNEKFYDSLLFHRVIKSFMIQGGDPTSKYADSTDALGSGDIGYRIPAEINQYLYHKKGALAAARDNNPEKASSGCQFYIVHGKTFTTQELEQMLNSRNLNNKQTILYACYQTDSVQKAVSSLQQSGDKEALRRYMENLQKVVDARYAEEYPKAFEVNLDHMGEYVNLGGAPHLDGSYTVFGEVELGLEVIDKIANQPTMPGDRPISNIRMKMRLLK
jgi:peptidyl-prolyl cis-trans isomerase B (cyclophilin B)